MRRKRLKRYSDGKKKAPNWILWLQKCGDDFQCQKYNEKWWREKKKGHLAQNKARFISQETLLRDTLVIVQRGGWLRRYLQCGPPTEESQRATKWPTEKIWHCKWVFLLVSNSPSIFLPFSVIYNSPQRTNSSLSSSFSPHCLFFFTVLQRFVLRHRNGCKSNLYFHTEWEIPYLATVILTSCVSLENSIKLPWIRKGLQAF